MSYIRFVCKAIVLPLSGLGLIFACLYLFERMNWMPNWNDRVFNTINRFIPEGWFIDRFALFHSYELNVMAAFSTIVVVMTIIIAVFVGIFG
ncbi:hypothetical protein ABC345_03365 [Shouchella sp. 1P09AA]|uniref:hypothetical protein n=1 Tax=unclassified Shouchella TaxID=2893065 RepID=UPI00399FF21D